MGHRAGQHVDHLELRALGIEQGHRQRVERHLAAEAIGEHAQHVVDGVAGDEQARDGVVHGQPSRALLQPPHLLDGRAQLAAEAGRQRDRAAGARPTEQRQRAHGAARRPQCDTVDGPPAEGPGWLPARGRRLADDRAQRHRPGAAGHHDHRLAARRPEAERAGGGAGQAEQAAQREFEADLQRGGRGQRGEQVGDDPRGRHAGVSTRPGRLPVWSPSLITMLPFTSTCSTPAA